MERAENGKPEPLQRVHLILDLESVRELYTGLAPSLATDGIFIELDDPEPPDALVAFRIMLPDRMVVLEGEGTVLWSRAVADGDRPTGMAVRFSELSPSTRETIDAVIDAHLAGGGELFDLETDADGTDVYPTDALVGGFPTLGSGRWQRRREVEAETEPLGPGRRPPLFRSTAEAAAIDLRFEEILHGLAGHPEDDEDLRRRELDESISAAVSTPAGAREIAEPERRDAGEPTSVSGADESGDEPIPSILDHWKRDIDAGVEDLAQRARSADRRELISASPPELERLPFDRDGSDELETRPVSPTDLSSGRRMAALQPRPWLWWIVGAAALALLAVTLFLLWPGQRPLGDVPDQTVAAGRNDGAPVADEDRSTPSAPDETLLRTATTPEAAPDASAPASRIRSISWRALAGATEIVIEADGPVDSVGVDTLRLDDPPRILVRVRGIVEPYTPYRVEVASSDLIAIRIGHHPELRPPTLYVVLDTTSNAVKVLERDVEGTTATIVVGRTGGG